MNYILKPTTIIASIILFFAVPSFGQQSGCYDLDNFIFGNKLGTDLRSLPGDTLGDFSGMFVTAELFYLEDNNFVFDTLEVVNQDYEPQFLHGINNLLSLKNITAKFDLIDAGPFPYLVQIHGYNYGTGVNFGFNGEIPRFYDDFSSIPEFIFPGVSFQATEVDDPNGQGIFFVISLISEVEIYEVSIGGENILLDNFCFDPNPGLDCRIYNPMSVPVCGSNNSHSIDLYVSHTPNNSLMANITMSGINLGVQTLQNNKIAINNINQLGNLPNVLDIQIEEISRNCSWATSVRKGECSQVVTNSCQIIDPTIQFTYCDENGDFLANIDFDTIGVTDSFKLRILSNFIETYSYSDLPITIPFNDSLSWIDANAGLDWILEITDSKKDSCRASFTTNTAILCGSDCAYDNFVINDVYCKSTLDSFFLSFNFDTTQTITDSFGVIIDNHFLGAYGYDQLPIQNMAIANSGFDLHSVTVFDYFGTNNLPTTCQNTIHFPTLCRECPEDLSATMISPPNISGQYTFFVDMLKPAGLNGQFEMFYDSIFIDTFFYNQLPLAQNFNCLDYSDTLKISIKDIDSTACVASTNFIINCDSVCYVPSYTAEVQNCTSTNFDLKLNFDPTNNPIFVRVSVNGTTVGTGSVADSLVFPNLPILTATNLDILVCEVGNPNDACCVETQLVNPCTIPQCEIEILSATPTACDIDGRFFIDLSVNVSNPTGTSFLVFVNGRLQSSGTYSQTLQQFQLGPFDGTSTTPFQIEVYDILIPECISSLDLPSPNCIPIPCSISNIRAEITHCDGDNFNMDLDFDYANVAGAFFTLFVEGEDQSFRPYNSLPFQLTNLKNDGDDEVSIRVCDLNDNTCCSTISIPNICNDCEILNFEVEPQSCNTNQRFNFLLKGEINALPTDSFDVLVNGQVFTSFGYLDLPTISSTGLLIGDFDGSILNGYTIGVASRKYDFCSSDTTLQYVCPPPPTCEMTNLTITDLPCDADGYYFINVDFDISNNLADSFNLYLNGLISNVYSYSDLPIQIGPFFGNGDAMNFLVTDLIDSDCRIGSPFTAPSCTPPPCQMSNLILQPTPCNSDGTYGLFLNFIVNNNTSTDFELYINGSLKGSFGYTELPLTVNDLVGNEENVAIVVRDKDDIACRIAGNYQSPFCPLPCSIENLTIEAQGCDIDGNFLLDVDFNLLNPVSDSFQIFVNGANNGIFSNDDTNVSIGPFSGDGNTLNIEVIDFADQNCSGVVSIQAPNCVVVSCQLWGFSSTLQNCDDNQEFLATIDFNYSDQGSSFELFENGSSKGDFPYSSLPLTVGPYPANGDIISYEIIDSSDSDCQLTGSISSPICNPPCNLIGLKVKDTKCTGDGNFSFALEFNQEFASDSFVLSGPNGFVETYAYIDIPILVGGLEGDGVASYPFQIVDQQSPNCVLGFSIFAEDCICEISNITTTTTNCDPNQNYSINLDFDFKNPGSSFLLEGNGFSQQYDYQDLPLVFGSFPGDLTTNTYTITDLSQTKCTETFDVSGPNCVPPCELSAPKISQVNCDNQGSFTVVIDFEHSNTGTEFRIGQEIFNYASLPITLGPFIGDGMTTQNLTIIDIEYPDCNLPLFIPANFCGANCSITNLQALVSACDSSGNFNLDLQFDFDNTNQTGFLATVNGNAVGTFSYNVPQPISLGTFMGDNVTSYNVAVFDLDDVLCFSAVSVPPVNCLPCEFSNLSSLVTDCNVGGEYSVWLDFDTQNGSNNGFSVTGNGVNYGSYAYADLPIELGPFEGDGTSVFEFLINDIGDSGCNIETSVGPVDCEINNCRIYNLTSIPTSCDSNGEFYVDLRFDYEDEGANGFIVRGNGTIYGIYSYDALPIQLGPFEGDGNTEYEFIIVDNEYSDCLNFTSIGAIDCNVTDCSITNLKVDLLDCNSDGTYQVSVGFDNENETSATFDLHTTRGLFGTYNLVDLPITIQNFPINGNPFDAIRVCITDNHLCCASSFFPAPFCDGACIEFETLPANTVFKDIQSGSTDTIIIENDVLVSSSFMFNEGGGQIFDSIIVENAYPFFEAATGVQITTKNAAVDFLFPSFAGLPCREVIFNYYHEGDIINFSVNGQPVQIVKSFEDLPFSISTGVKAEVFPVNAREGSIKLKGFIKTVKIGGSNLSIDNICYSDCQIATSIWPGDINVDNLVSNFDILNLGIAYGAVGPARDQFNVNWEELPAEDWLRNFGRGNDYKHSDCNGDGIIDFNDLEVIDDNYGSSNEPILTFPPEFPPPNAPSLYIEYPDPSTIQANVPFTMKVMLAEETNQVFNLYGLAFNLRYDNTAVQILNIKYPPGWYGEKGDDVLTIDRIFGAAGVANVGMTRINHENVTGYGLIAEVDGIIIIEDIVQRQGRIEIEIDGVSSIDKDELTVPINGKISSLVFEPSNTIDTYAGSLEVYPNPTSDKFHFDVNNEQKIELVEILSADGKVLQSLIPKANFISLDQHAPGIYLVKFVIDGNLYYDKVVKQ